MPIIVDTHFRKNYRYHESKKITLESPIPLPPNENALLNRSAMISFIHETRSAICAASFGSYPGGRWIACWGSSFPSSLSKFLEMSASMTRGCTLSSALFVWLRREVCTSMSIYKSVIALYRCRYTFRYAVLLGEMTWTPFSLQGPRLTSSINFSNSINF